MLRAKNFSIPRRSGAKWKGRIQLRVLTGLLLIAGFLWIGTARAETCLDTLSGKVVSIKDGLIGRVVTNQATTSASFTGQVTQLFEIRAAEVVSGCQYYKLVEKEGSRLLIAGDKGGNDQMYIQTQDTAGAKDNARWKFIAAVEGRYYIRDKLAGRTLIADGAKGPALSAFASNRFKTTDLNAQWVIEEQDLRCETISSPSRSVFLKDAKHLRRLTKAANTTTSLNGYKDQQWEIRSAGIISGCQYYYLIEQEESSYLAADSNVHDDHTHMEYGASDKAHAQWRFVKVSGTTDRYYLKERKVNRTLIADAGTSPALSAFSSDRYKLTDTNAQWIIEKYEQDPECRSFLSPLDNQQSHRLIEITYTKPASMDFPHYESTAGEDVAHAQGSLRLPDKDGYAYFMFSASQNKTGYLWIVKVKLRNGGLTNEDSAVVWSTRTEGCTSVENCNSSQTQGSFNHPAQMALLPGSNIVAVALQNYNAMGYLKKPEIHGDDSLGFYDVTIPTAPKFMFKFVGNQLGAAHWGWTAPGSPAVIKNVAIGRWNNGKHFMFILEGRHYSFVDISKLNPSSSGRDIALLGGNFAQKRGHIYTTGMVGTSASKEYLLDMNFAIGHVDARLVNASNDVVRTCYYGYISPYRSCVGDPENCKHWRKEGCDKTGTISNNWNQRTDEKNKVNFICHHKKPEQYKFIVMDY